MLDEQKGAYLANIYNAVHKEMLEFRSMGYHTGSVYATFAIAVIGWTVSNKKEFGAYILPIWFTVVVIATYVFVYTHRMEKQLQLTAEVINKIEAVWGAFEPKYFSDQFNKPGDDVLFPKAWSAFGDKLWKEPIFFYTKVLIALQLTIYTVLCTLVWFRVV